MNAPDSRTEAGRWLQYAHEDLAAARVMAEQEALAPRHACWLAQQAAEKAVKAALVFTETDFPKSHDLDALKNLLPRGWQVREMAEELSSLTEWSVEARYPGDWPEATSADAATAVSQALTVLKAIEDDLSR